MARLLRLCYYNLRLRFSTDMLDSLATIRYSRETDVIQLNVTQQRKTLAPRPGEHYFLYQPLRWRGWESHPFTLATWEPVKSSDVVEDTAEEKGQMPSTGQEEYMQDDKSPYPTQAESGPSSTMSLPDNETWERRKLIFWLRPCSGWTRSLRDTCLQQPHLKFTTKLLIEGPYGHTVPLHTYDNVLYIIGGTGISVATSYLTDHMGRSANPPRTRTKNIRLLWAVRQAQHIVETFEGPVGPVFKCDGVNVRLYATGQAGISQKAKDLGITPRRPNVRDEVFRYVEEVCHTERTAVLMCGPAGMADAVRDAVKAVVNNGRVDVEYFEEAYGW
jgi:NAD(P)H-flavin reductase